MIDSTPDQILQALPAGSIWVASAVALLFCTFWLARLWRDLRRPAILIDGSNLLWWGGETPEISPVRAVVAALKAQGYRPEVVFDATVGWRIADRWLGPQALSPMIGLPPARITVVARGETADEELLATATQRGLRIVTNDRFRDWAFRYPLVREAGRLVPGYLGPKGPEFGAAAPDATRPAPKDRRRKRAG